MWQYQVVEWSGKAAPRQPRGSNLNAVRQMLLDMGQRRWELVTLTNGDAGSVYYFKRWVEED
jgi:hypothetical protein